MEKLLFIKPILQLAERGILIRSVVFWILRILAVLVVLGGLYLFIEILRLAFGSGALVAFAGLIAALIQLAVFVIAAEIMWVRAQSVNFLPDGAYPAVRIIAVVLRLAGELYAAIVSGLSVALCLAIWIAGAEGGYLLRELIPSSSLFMPGGITTGFLGGLLALIVGIVFAVSALILLYFLAEIYLAIIDIATNTKRA